MPRPRGGHGMPMPTNISGWPTMVESLTLLVDRLQTPIGELLIVADSAGKLRTIDWTDHEARMRRLLDRYYGKGGYALQPARDPGGLTRAMRDYFKGDIGAIDRLPLDKSAKTISYAELARRIGKPKAVRAAGLANGQNPISIVVPCHRVIGSNGTLTGYGGGLPRKKWLLEHEGALAAKLS